MKLKQNNGVTLIALAVTIIILLIIAGIAIYSGRETIQRANLESLRTNMLLIEAKAKGVVEEANFQLGPDLQKKDDIDSIRYTVYEEENKLQKISNISNIPSEIPIGNNVYVFTEDTAELWGLNKVWKELDSGEYYLIAFDEENASVEIYNTLGYNGNYSLTQIDSINE